MMHPFMTTVASTKRNPAPVSGRITAPVAYLTTLRVTPLWPVSNETVRQLDINSPREMKECFAVPDGDTLPDVKEGDILTVAGVDYPIYWAGEWPDLSGGIPTLQLVVSQIKGT